MGTVSWLAVRKTVCAVLFVIIFSFLSFMDGCCGGGASVVVGPCALIVFSGFAALICAALLTGIPVAFLGSLTTYEVVSLFDTSLTCWGVCVVVVVGRGARILRPARRIVCVVIRSVVAALCLAASCFLYTLTWALCWRGLVGAGIDEVDGFLGEEVILLL